MGILVPGVMDGILLLYFFAALGKIASTRTPKRCIVNLSQMHRNIRPRMRAWSRDRCPN
jgi:hypothetical protein